MQGRTTIGAQIHALLVHAAPLNAALACSSDDLGEKMVRPHADTVKQSPVIITARRLGLSGDGAVTVAAAVRERPDVPEDGDAARFEDAEDLTEYWRVRAVY